MNSKRHDRELTADEMAKLKAEDIDFSDIPELGDPFWAKAKLVMPEPEGTQQVTLRIKRSVLEAYKNTGKGYQTRMNTVLETYARTLRKE